MNRLIVVVLISPVVAIANPLLTGVINEFQTDTILGQKFEFHPINYGSEIPLLGTMVYTPNCSAYIDTNINNPPYGYTVIDTSFLNGTFHLNQQNGYIEVYKSDYFWDVISYADTFHSPILAPLPGTSASRFVCILFYNYPTPTADWYIDYTPTFGSENDDYPGCAISGYVYLNSIPVENARVTASLYDSIITPGPFYKSCTTFTNSNGFYIIDSLWPARYWMTASFGTHQPVGELSPTLCALWERNLNFYFVDIEESDAKSLNRLEPLVIFPNPFRHLCRINIQIPYPQSATNQQSEINLEVASIKIYDATGRLVKDFSRSTGNNEQSTLVWSGEDNSGRRLPAGVYFIRLEAGDITGIAELILIR